MSERKKGIVGLVQRFEEKFTKDADGCWRWTGYLSEKGYGHFHMNSERHSVPAHRVSYEIYMGPIPDGLTIDHLCRVKSCVNPAHLEPVTSRDNTLRSDNPAMQLSRATHCIAGHEFSGHNLITDEKTGHRRCRACNARRGAEYRARLHDVELANPGNCAKGHPYDGKSAAGNRTCSICMSSPRPAAVKAHCKWGHEIAGDNIIMSGGRTRCKKCLLKRCADYYKRKTGKITA